MFWSCGCWNWWFLQCFKARTLPNATFWASVCWNRCFLQPFLKNGPSGGFHLTGQSLPKQCICMAFVSSVMQLQKGRECWLSFPPPTGGNITAWVIFDGDSAWPTCVFSGTPKWVWPKMVIHGLQCDPQFRGFDLEVVPTRTQRTNSCTQIQIHRLWCHDTPFGRHWKHFDTYP